MFDLMSGIQNTLCLGGWDAVAQGGGWKLTVLGMLVVFAGLVVLTLIFSHMERIIGFFKARIQSLKPILKDKKDEPVQEKQMTGEEAAAACLALALYQRMHMEERRQILTMKSELKLLSPWALSGKIHRTSL